MSNIGYKRVSTVDQNTDRQLAGVNLDKVFEDKLSGKDTNRPGLQACLSYLREGDTLHVHWICPYISRHLLSLNPLLACCRRYSRGER